MASSRLGLLVVVALLVLKGLVAFNDRLWDEQVIENRLKPETAQKEIITDSENEVYPDTSKDGYPIDEVSQDDEEENKENKIDGEEEEGGEVKIGKIGEKVAPEEEIGNEIGEGPEIPYTEGLFEGDIDGVNASDVDGRNAVINPYLKWPQGRVPFLISGFNGNAIRVINAAINQYNQHTCIRFVPRRGERDFVVIRPGYGGCSSMVGRQGGRQFVNLGGGCVYTGIVVHELMHAIGFWHEQSRSDRDNYVRIHWNNIPRNQAHNFQKFSHGAVDLLHLPYDIGSVMHYGAYYFAINSRFPTITTLNGSTRMGQRNGFSRLDVTKINKFYKCRNGRSIE